MTFMDMLEKQNLRLNPSLKNSQYEPFLEKFIRIKKDLMAHAHIDRSRRREVDVAK